MTKKVKFFVFVCSLVLVFVNLRQAIALEGIFPQGLAERDWVRFSAKGFSEPVTGVIYRDGTMKPGMPLGALGTGFISLGTEGTLDYVNTIFNTFFIRSNAYGYGLWRSAVATTPLPFMGMAVEGKTTVLSLKPIDGIQGVKQIDYWGHYPVADMEFDTDRPVHVSLRAWTPFFPRDGIGSNTPGSVFEVQLRNDSSEEQKGCLAFSFSGPRRIVPDAINGYPCLPFIGDEPIYELPPLSKDNTAAPTELSGDPEFTVFFLGVINRAADQSCAISWGQSHGTRKGSAIEIESPADRLDWSIGGVCAVTPEGSFKNHYGKPTIICLKRSPGTILETTGIRLNGVNQPINLSYGSPSVRPDIAPTAIRLGGGDGFNTSQMAVAEVIIYNRALTNEEDNAIGSYLEKKYGLDTNYPDSDTSVSPDSIDNLYIWFKADSITGDEKDDNRFRLDKDLFLNVKRQVLKGPFTGVSVEGKRNGFELGYALGVMGNESVRFGCELDENPKAWKNISSKLPEPSADDRGASVAVDFDLKPGEKKTLRFVLAWYAPLWKSSGLPGLGQWGASGDGQHAGTPYLNMYSARFKDAVDVAEYLTREHPLLLDRILAWQQVIYGEEKIPGWLQDSLINVLAVLGQNSFMMKSSNPSHWWGDEGFFCVNESLMSCPQQSCIGCDQIAEWAVNLLFPEEGLRKLTAFKHYQKQDTGEPPSTLGCGTEADRPWYSQQLALDAQYYIHMVERYRQSSGNDAVLNQWYSSVKAAMNFMFTLDEDGDSLPDVHDRNHYLDTWPMEGAAPHVATYWLSTLLIAERMAQMRSDDLFAQECRRWYQKAADSIEQILWNPKMNSYWLYHDTQTGKKSDTVMCDQLMGQMHALLLGFPGVSPPERVKSVLATLERLNYADNPYGIRLASRPDGSIDTTGHYAQFIIPSYSTLAVAISMLYSGDPHFEELGLEIVRRTWHNMVIQQNLAWDQPAMVRMDGTRGWGLEYYHNPMLWVLPVAVLGQDVRTACSPGGFIERIRYAAKYGKPQN